MVGIIGLLVAGRCYSKWKLSHWSLNLYHHDYGFQGEIIAYKGQFHIGNCKGFANVSLMYFSTNLNLHAATVHDQLLHESSLSNEELPLPSSLPVALVCTTYIYS